MLKEQSCFNKHRSEIVQGTISFRQLRWPFAQGTISFRQLRWLIVQGTISFRQLRWPIVQGTISFRQLRWPIVQGTISFRQLRWPFAQGTISFRQLRWLITQATTPVSQVRCTFCRMSNASIADVEAMLPSKQRHYPYPPGSFVSRTRPPCKMPFPICALHTYYIIYAKRPFLRRKPFFSSCSPMCSCPIYEVFKCELASFILTI